MNEIRCPHCQKVFQVDDAGYAQILAQVRNEQFNKEIQSHQESLRLRYEAQQKSMISDVNARWQKELAEKSQEIVRLQEQAKAANADKTHAVDSAVHKLEMEVERLKGELQHARDDREKHDQVIAEQHQSEVNMLKDQIQQIKDFKARLSTKMVGESLEQHCLMEFNKLRTTAFQNAYFEKDNDARTGSKGDFIYRDYTEDGIEFVSIMFEMKNEMESTATKHHNEDFFKELDKDRNEKHCEYAVLVSMLEADSDLYNQGIVDVSYRYPKMYVVRPQFFIPLITLLRNAAKHSADYKRQLADMQKQNIDITNFEKELLAFKEGFSNNYIQASKRFDEALEGIDKAIAQMQKIREKLTLSQDHLRRANTKAEDLSIKKLTKNNPTMQARFKEVGADID